jgi:hypothetical protein
MVLASSLHEKAPLTGAPVAVSTRRKAAAVPSMSIGIEKTMRTLVVAGTSPAPIAGTTWSACASARVVKLRLVSPPIRMPSTSRAPTTVTV